MEGWKKYIEATKESPPRKLLVEALPYVLSRNRALDLGSGSGNDARFLESEGFVVDAVDSNSDSKARLSETIRFYDTAFSAFDFPNETYDLVNAQYSLPFNAPDTFDEVMNKLKDSLKHSGVFTGQFFGPEDEWSNDSSRTFIDRMRIQELFNGYALHKLSERKEIGPLATGGEKFWHVFDVIAQKP